jgi:hypothetical protein
MSDLGFVTTIARRWRSPRERMATLSSASRAVNRTGFTAAGAVGTNRIAHLFDDEGGGDEGTRTPDPLLAKEVLSQLSYIPVGPMLADRGGWWAFVDSNHGPLPYQGSALTS